MKKCRAIICALLALVMILPFSACDRVKGEEVDKASSVPKETEIDESTVSPEETPDEASAAVSIPSEPPEDRSDLVILNWEEYVNRPHEIQPGTVLNYAIKYDVPSQLPWNCVSEGWLWGNVYEGLLYMYMNDPTDIRGCIAESWEHSDDYLTWTFQIRDGVTFHDGTACDAPAIESAWKYTQGAAPAYIRNCNITSWEAIDARTFVVHLSVPCAYFEQTMAGNRLILVSPSALDLYGLNDNKAAIGTGPYYIESYTSGVSIVLEANKDYYLDEKMPCIETVNFSVIEDNYDLLNALLNGKVDGANINRFENDYFINGRDVNSYQYLKENGYGGNLAKSICESSPMWFNAEKVEVFQTLEVREAICRFIDFDAINGQLYNGMGSVQDSLWAAGSTGYVPTDQFYYDLDAGQARLASVGIEPSDIKFEANYSDYNEDVFFAVQKELEKAEVELDLEPIVPEYDFPPLMKGDWSIEFNYVGYSNSAPYLPWTFILKPDALIKMCWQDVYNPELYQKMQGEYDAMFSSATWDEMLTHCKQLTAYVQDDFGAIGGVQPPAFVALRKEFKNGIYFSESHDIQLYYLYQ